MVIRFSSQVNAKNKIDKFLVKTCASFLHHLVKSFTSIRTGLFLYIYNIWLSFVSWCAFKICFQPIKMETVKLPYFPFILFGLGIFLRLCFFIVRFYMLTVTLKFDYMYNMNLYAYFCWDFHTWDVYVAIKNRILSMNLPSWHWGVDWGFCTDQRVNCKRIGGDLLLQLLAMLIYFKRLCFWSSMQKYIVFQKIALILVEDFKQNLNFLYNNIV